MEENKQIRIGLFSVVLLIILFVLLIGFMYMFLENKKLNKKVIEYNDITVQLNSSTPKINELNSLVNELNEKNKTIEQLEKENDELRKNNTSKQPSNSINIYEINQIKNIYDIISDSDTKIVKAQKIANEVMNAINNKDWYYLAKMVGTSADDFINYGIYNYKVDINDYEEINGEYIFGESYDWDKTKLSDPKDVSLGSMLIIKFEDGGGRIVIYPNCTGI